MSRSVVQGFTQRVIEALILPASTISGRVAKGFVEILDPSGICHPESLRFWQGEGYAFRLSVAIYPGIQQSRREGHRPLPRSSILISFQ